MTGLISRSFPDNSVVCHANRLIYRNQDNFVTGAALGVNCAEVPLDFFPDVYNEDWLFFAAHAARGQIVCVGAARQQPYKPFADPKRAVTEEFGDLIAEGLYELFNHGQSLDAATKAYWDEFISARKKLIERLADDLYLIPTREADPSLRVDSACWQATRLDHRGRVCGLRKSMAPRPRSLRKDCKGIPGVGDYAAAFELQLDQWREAELLPDSRRLRIPVPPARAKQERQLPAAQSYLNPHLPIT